MIDLHTHSSASDGGLSPTALIALAAESGLGAIALTDHDTLAGLAEAKSAAEAHGIRFIGGVEIEIAWEPGECHLLGLGLGSPSEGLVQALVGLAASRHERNLLMLGLMKEAGMEASWEELASHSAGKVVGRPHFAALMVARKFAKNTEQAFNRFLGKGRSMYLPKAGLEFSRAVSLIKESGGVAVLAHPLSLYVSWGRLPGILAEWKELGLDGIEAWHPIARVRSCERLEALGRSLGYLVTAGSDFHGGARLERRLGFTAGGKKIDESYLEGIPAH